MTLKQAQVIKNLPKTKYNLAEAMRKSGYSHYSAYSGHTRQGVLNATKKLDFFSEEKIRKDINQVRKLALKKEDITNLNRIDEHRAKIAGLIVDKQETKGGEKLIIIDRSNSINTSDTTELT